MQRIPALADSAASLPLSQPRLLNKQNSGITIMKHSHTAAIVLSTLLLSVSGLAQAQSLKPPVESSRAAAFMDRDVFLSTHIRDDLTGKWVVKSEHDLPKNIKSKSDVMGQAPGAATTTAYGYPAPLAN